MKKFVIALAMVATLAGNGAYAQTAKPAGAKMGSGAQAGTYTTSNFAWGIGLGALVVVGLVVGLTVGAATGSQSTH